MALIESTQNLPPTTTSLAEQFGGGRLLLSDLRTALLLLNHARHLALRRVFGLSKEEDNLLTLIILLLAANEVHDRATRLFKFSVAPTGGDWLLATGCVEELVNRVAGPAVRQTPQLGMLLTMAVAVGRARPALTRSIHFIGGTSHRMTVGFHHRYGYLIDSGRRRVRRARRNEHGIVS